MNGTSRDRLEWLETATTALRRLFEDKGFKVPAKVRVSMGWPSSRKDGRIGECWNTAASADGHAEIFLSPEIGVPAKANVLRQQYATTLVLATLAHELVHATVGGAAGHGAVFKRCAVAIGLTGKMTATVAGDAFKAWAGPLMDEIGVFPAGALLPGSGGAGRKKQSTRLLKCECGICGYVARVTNKWICEAGTPICPADNEAMEVEA